MVNRLRTAPWRLQATADGSRVRVSWEPPAAGAAPDAYVLEVGSSRFASDVTTLNTASRSTILEAIGPPGTYYMRVRARGTVLSSPSNEVRLVIGSTATPGAPSALTAVTTGRTFTFNWLGPHSGSIAPTTGYVIEAGSAAGLSNLASMRLGNTTTFNITNVPLGTYYVRVRAENANGRSAPTNEVIVISTAGPGHCSPVEIPPPPAFRISGSSVTFEWDPPQFGAAPTGYQFEAGTAPGLANIAFVPLGSGRAFSASAPRGTYFLQLRATNPCGTSPQGPSVRLDIP
jgi:hypothetical protein